MFTVINLVHRLFQLLMLVVVIKVFLSYFMSPWHPVRQFIDRLVEPFLRPIRRMMPDTGMVDFSPMVLILLLWVLEILIRGLLVSL